MTTGDIVNKFICTRAYSSCLEISARGSHLGGVHCARRLCVYPLGAGDADVSMSSYDFFASSAARFDVIIIDGVHSCGHVLRDIDNALEALNPGGIVVVRNCLPTDEGMASPKPRSGAWCGDVYRAAAWHFARSPHLCYTVDADYGCGIVDTACAADSLFAAPAYGSPEALTYADFDANRAALLHVVGEQDVPAMVMRGVKRHQYVGDRPMYVITPTGDRPDGFAMCVDYVNRQTKKPDMWLIVDDGRTDAVASQLSRIEVPHKVIRLPPIDGENTLLRNLGAALAEVPDSACVCVVEDDDWYPANYLATVYPLLQENDFVSIRECHYYHVPTRQYRLMHGTPTNGDGWSGPAIPAIRAWVSSGLSSLFDNKFGRCWCGTMARHDAIPGHIVGFGTGRAGVTSSHRINAGENGWDHDPAGDKLREWVGDDVVRYIGERGKVYVISNVDYPREARLAVDEDDILVFLNTARSIDYYDDHENKVIYHRTPGSTYGEERLCVKNRYVFDAGDLGIPSSFIRSLKAGYDWDYPIEKDKVKSATTGYMVAKYMEHIHPDREIVLVNFGYTVAKSTYRCPWHNWVFEAHELAKFRHIFTATVHDEAEENIVPYTPRNRSPDERRVAYAFTLAGSDRMTSHDYAAVFTEQVMRLTGRKSRIAEVGGLAGSGVRGFMKLLPEASVYAVGLRDDAVVAGSESIFGDGYAAGTWNGVPEDFDLIVDDGSHRIKDMLRGIQVFLAHLKAGGVLMFEDVSSEEDVAELLRRLPGAVCHRTAKISPHDDDRIVVYTKPAAG